MLADSLVFFVTSGMGKVVTRDTLSYASEFFFPFAFKKNFIEV